jgi:hypothetical protein
MRRLRTEDKDNPAMPIRRTREGVRETCVALVLSTTLVVGTHVVLEFAFLASKV